MPSKAQPSDLSNESLREMVNLAARMGKAGAARHLGIPATTLKSRLAIAARRGIKADPAETPREPSLTSEMSDKTGTVTSCSATIRTLDDALKAAKVDLSVWEVERHVINKWDSARSTKADTWDAIELWQVKVWLRRKAKSVQELAIESLLAKVRKAAPRFPRLVAPSIKDPHMLEIGLYDMHFGKLAWAREVGSSYDLDIARTVFRNAAEDLLNKIGGVNVERVLLPVGNDFLHINGTKSQTVNGTQLDSDGRYPKVWEVGAEAMVWLVDLLLKRAPVDLVWVGGNHDYDSSYGLAQYLKAWFRNTYRVNVDVGPAKHKKYRYGVTLLGLAHGDASEGKNINPKDLPLMMADEWPKDWAETLHHEYHIGHFHTAKEISFTSTNSKGSVRVRVLPSLCATDTWHYANGYIGGQRAAEAYLWSKERGYMGHLNAPVREPLPAKKAG